MQAVTDTPKPKTCGTCEHADRANLTDYQMAPCTKNPYPFRLARTYAAHAPCDKGVYQPRQPKTTPKGKQP